MKMVKLHELKVLVFHIGLIDEATSLFTYGNGKNHNDFVNTQYKPLFFDEIKSLFSDKRLEIKAKAICGDVKECLYDVAASGSVSFGKSTKQAIDHFTKIKKDINTGRLALILLHFKI